MAGGTLVVSRAVNLYSYYKQELAKMGFKDLTFTDAGYDALNMLINELKPRLLLIDSAFYQGGTPYMTGVILKRFTRLNIAVVSMDDYPLKKAAWFIWHGVKSYVRWWDGREEFFHGMRLVRDGRQYISPLAQKIIDRFDQWPDTSDKTTKRTEECLELICCGLDPDEIGRQMQITRKTVYSHLDYLYSAFHARNREEMVAIAWELGLVTREDIRFHSKKDMNIKLPQWAERRIKMGKEEMKIKTEGSTHRRGL
jgi:DNA-binding NarL/FixJ family response regulator